jgi:circadian clock protein KaiC
MAQSDLIPTGISGLDLILRGGIPDGNVILLEGAIGTGKTLLGTEFIYRGAVDYGEPGIIVTFEVSPRKLMRDAANFGWDLDALQQQNQVRIIFTSPQVLSQELRAPDSLLLEIAAEMGARRILIDGISLLRALPNGFNNGNEDHGNGIGRYRQTLQQLLEGLQRENLTAVVTHEVTSIAQQAFALEITEYLADTVIVLRREPNRRGASRSLEITKSRGQPFDAGRHTLRITAGKGLEVFRRAQAPPLDLDEERQPTSSRRQSVIGSAPLDELFGGGVYDGSVTMVGGVSGVGKSILSMQLLLEGANHQRPGLLVSLDEHLEQIMRNAETLGLNLRAHLDSGMIQFFYDCPREIELDVHFARIA